ncbi:MAG: low molecular weight phosphotyrosine protein phosphatase [Clostridia bacterium]|nr:low molecular weight phosphotyrosine protein phosphatase [Clostridia bacterium]
MNILFLCHGNICRSPMAEFVMKKELARRNLIGHKVWSRALRTDEIGSDTYPPARRTMDAHGVPYERRQATLITQKDYDEADVIYIMDEENERDMRRRYGLNKVRKLMTEVGEDRDVADPWYTRNFELTYDDIQRSCSAIAEKL